MLSKPILEKTCPTERTTAAPTGRASAQSGQVAAPRAGRRVSMTTAVIMPAVPKAVAQVRFSPNQSTPSAAANSGEVELRVLDSVGPRYRIPATARLAETAGRNSPIRTKIQTADCDQFAPTNRNGANNPKKSPRPQLILPRPCRIERARARGSGNGPRTQTATPKSRQTKPGERH